MVENINPPILNWLVCIFSTLLSIFFIFDGNKAYNAPSINKRRPIAMMSSSIVFDYCFLITPVFPKNLKKSLSGDKIKEVSPPINAFS